MLTFSKEIGGGWFGWDPRYAMMMRIECDSEDELLCSWENAIGEIALWRSKRGDKALQVDLTLIYEGDDTLLRQLQAFVAERCLCTATVPAELAQLRVNVAVFNSEMEQRIDLILYPPNWNNIWHRQ